MAIIAYRIGHTIGKASLGGVHDGFRIRAYQCGISGVVAFAPMTAIIVQAAANARKASVERMRYSMVIAIAGLWLFRANKRHRSLASW
jgi:hypothetical protein